MTQTSLLEQAKQGNVKVLASLMNRLLKSHGMMADLNRDGDRLEILIESDKRSLTEEFRIPNRPALVLMIKKWLVTLGVQTISKVEVSWQRTGEDCPAWSEEFELVVPLQAELLQKIAGIHIRSNTENPPRPISASLPDQIPAPNPTNPEPSELGAWDYVTDPSSYTTKFDGLASLSPPQPQVAKPSDKSIKRTKIVTVVQYLLASLVIVGIVAVIHHFFAQSKSAKEGARSGIQSSEVARKLIADQPQK